MVLPNNDRNKDAQVCSFTLRPAGGVKLRDERNLMYFVKKHCSQWEIYEEITEHDDDGDTRHFHGRLLFKTRQRFNNMKRNFITAMGYVLAQKTVLQNGIKWLYDDWPYLRKDEEPWSSHITDEEEWALHYADPKEKYVKQKNSESWFYINLFKDKLGDHVSKDQVTQLLRPFIGSNEVQVPGSESAMANLAWRISTVWNCHCENEADEFANM